MVNWVGTKFPGVRCWESDVRSIDGKTVEKGKKKPKSWKPDRCYLIRYGAEGRRKTETVGWESQGITPQYCSNLRGKIISSIKTGQGPYQSLKEKTELEKERRELEEADKISKQRENIPFHVLGDHYIEWAKDEKPSSYFGDESRYRNHLKPFLGDLLLKDISPFTLEKLKKRLKAKKTPGQKPLSPKTIQHCLALIRQMYNKAQGWELYSGPNPVTEAAKVHKKFLQIPDNRRLRFFSKSQAGQLLAYLRENNTQLHDMTILGLYAGLRANEIFSLLWRDIDLESGIINIKDPKGLTNRAAYVTEPIRKMLVRRKRESPGNNSLIFKSKDDSKIKQISSTFERAICKLKFNEGVEDSRDKIVFHSTRHTFASWLAMAGTDLATLQKLMGHKKIEMTLRYAHLCPSHEREAAERMAREGTTSVIGLKGTEKYQG